MYHFDVVGSLASCSTDFASALDLRRAKPSWPVPVSVQEVSTYAALNKGWDRWNAIHVWIFPIFFQPSNLFNSFSWDLWNSDIILESTFPVFEEEVESSSFRISKLGIWYRLNQETRFHYDMTTEPFDATFLVSRRSRMVSEASMIL